MNCTLIGVAIALLAGIPLVGSSRAEKIIGQEPCVTAEGYCVFFHSGDPISVVRSFTFVTPSRGSVLALFQGRIECIQVSGTDVGEIDFAAQIAKKKDLTPVDANGPSGLRYHAVLNGYPGVFNLATYRVISYREAGPKTVEFRISRLSQALTVNCAIYTAAFSVVFSTP